MKYYLATAVMILGMSINGFADVGEVIDLDENTVENLIKCSQFPDNPATYSNSISAGWAKIGLGEVIEEVKFLNPNVVIEARWSYGPISRKVTLRVNGKCRDVKKAAIMIESIH